MKINDDDILQAYIHYRKLITDTDENKYEFEYCGNIIQLSPDICLDTGLKWHIKIKQNDGYHLIGTCGTLWDIKIILSQQYILDVLKTKENLC